MIEAVAFYSLATMAVVPALLVVVSKNVFHSALWLVLSLLGVAGLYASLAADFLFAVQVMVYAGGIMVILLFVILLSGKPADWAEKNVNENFWAAALFSGFFVAFILTVLSKWGLVSKPAAEPLTTTGPLGELLLGQMVLPFEVIAVVLVVGLIGAIYFSSKRSS